MNNSIVKNIPMEIKGGIITSAVAGGLSLIGSAIGLVTGINKTGKSWNEFTDKEKEKVVYLCKRALMVAGVAVTSSLLGYLIGYAIGDNPTRYAGNELVPAHPVKLWDNPNKLNTVKKYMNRAEDVLVLTMDNISKAVQDEALNLDSEAGSRLMLEHYAMCRSMGIKPHSADKIIPEDVIKDITNKCFNS